MITVKQNWQHSGISKVANYSPSNKKIIRIKHLEIILKCCEVGGLFDK